MFNMFMYNNVQIGPIASYLGKFKKYQHSTLTIKGPIEIFRGVGGCLGKNGYRVKVVDMPPGYVII